MSNIGEVIGWKFNHQAGMETSDGVITAFPDGIPSQADQDSWTAEYEAHLVSTEYQRTRAVAYEEVKEQLDQLYHDMTAGKLDATGEWHKAIKAVKDATPKP